MESHALHGDGIYYESGDKLWINLYAPSTAEWKSAGVTFSNGYRISRSVNPPQSAWRWPRRRNSPSRCGNRGGRPTALRIKVNGENVGAEALGSGPFAAPGATGSFVEIRRTWKTGDNIEITLPKSLHLGTTAGQSEPRGDPVGAAGACRQAG